MANNILALDIATKTGWRTKTSSGVWDLKPNRGESEGMRVVRSKSKVKERRLKKCRSTFGYSIF